VACNMAAVPLGETSVDAAVFSLALMGTDYGAFLQVGWRGAWLCGTSGVLGQGGACGICGGEEGVGWCGSGQACWVADAWCLCRRRRCACFARVAGFGSLR
jgi:hypothetical protein